MSVGPQSAAPAALGRRRIGRAWQTLWEARLGILPVPLAGLAVAVLLTLAWTGGTPADLPTCAVLLACGGFACAEVGRRIPVLNGFGLAAILATFAPAFLVERRLLPASFVAAIAQFTDQSNLLYLFIAAVVVGSLLGMDRQTLVAGFARIFAPLLLGSLAALAVGCAVGSALGLGVRHTLFKIVVPIMAGGVGEGAIPLSLGYAQLGGGQEGEHLAEILPAVMFGSLTAIVLAGALNRIGARWPTLTSQGRMDGDAMHAEDCEAVRPGNVEHFGAALVLALALYLLGLLAQRLWHWPAPIVMLMLAVGLKLGRLAPAWLEQAAHANYRFFAACVTYPLLFAIGVAKTPWEKLVAAFNAPTIATIAATVAALVTTGFATARWFGMAPVECALVNACHSGQGGTGDVAILTAAGRLELMPFAQIATRLGGGLTVATALVAFAAWRG